MVAALQEHRETACRPQKQPEMPGECINPPQIQRNQSKDPVLSWVQCWLGVGQQPPWVAISGLDPETKALHSQWPCLTIQRHLHRLLGAIVTSYSCWCLTASVPESFNWSRAQWGQATSESPVHFFSSSPTSTVLAVTGT